MLGNKQVQYCHQNDTGATTVETAITIFPVMFILIAFIQLTLLALSFGSMHFALNKAARWGSIGTVYTGLSREDSIKSRFTKAAVGLPFDVSDAEFSICPATNPACSIADNSAGTGGQFVILRATKPMAFFFGLGNFSVSAQLLMKNEPF